MIAHPVRLPHPHSPAPLRDGPRATGLASLLAALALGVPTTAQSLAARLEPSQVVPPASSAASGNATIVVDAAAGTITIQGTYSDLGSSLDLAALHGPAAVGSGGPTVASLSDTGGTTGTFQGVVSMTPAELSALFAGQYYLDLHTALLSGGELRGQILPQASASSRTAGTNPASYAADAPLLGATWTGTVDLTSTGHPIALIVGFDAPVDILLSGGQRLLCFDQGGNGEVLDLGPRPGPLARFQASVPNDMQLAGSRVYTQAVHLGGGARFALGNAQDLVFGL